MLMVFSFYFLKNTVCVSSSLLNKILLMSYSPVIFLFWSTVWTKHRGVVWMSPAWLASGCQCARKKKHRYFSHAPVVRADTRKQNSCRKTGVFPCQWEGACLRASHTEHTIMGLTLEKINLGLDCQWIFNYTVVFCRIKKMCHNGVNYWEREVKTSFYVHLWLACSQYNEPTPCVCLVLFPYKQVLSFIPMDWIKIKNGSWTELLWGRVHIFLTLFSSLI